MELEASYDKENSKSRMQYELSKLSDPKIKFTILNLRRIASKRWYKSPNWVLVNETFELGSTYSFALCKMHGIDPESTK